ncbi:DUF1311 domain-containing protein [Bacillus atrophaeus]|uniref:lysozyme inhibitor LprI family protein n=1 Tax=Bacillus atrophaeus TaxID=1452 RepID=UPI002282A7EB|nr:lysozyme inhibitor LprI family protein [Bacillus atrophaeus]MCY8497443.1 DUF1311 domain-containing protein [Bacillus atrophaeus]MCY8812526.1 DUF1311 domain-containing protein [Bacillus atrophaeus]MCY8819224.1 DUF1311 domain-containing protein [Bacillus atrophaeus]MCY8827261.1 DUF1311 domain-containing protein [Bacillus atrophaeus]MCY8832826.1 DUF1311 domain-containing protein [Bacillus atrophaeus]
MIEYHGYNYQIWDAFLNEIYGVQKQFSASEMDALRMKQRLWIKDRDAAPDQPNEEKVAH